MRKAVVVLVLALSATIWSQAPQKEKSAETLIRQALDTADDLKLGATRADVEKHWAMDGGLNFREKTRYSYRECAYIKIDVEYEVDSGTPAPNAANGYAFSGTDKVKQISRPYLEYPVAD